jgi:hypothetical protein
MSSSVPPAICTLQTGRSVGRLNCTDLEGFRDFTVSITLRHRATVRAEFGS